MQSSSFHSMLYIAVSVTNILCGSQDNNDRSVDPLCKQIAGMKAEHETKVKALEAQYQASKAAIEAREHRTWTTLQKYGCFQLKCWAFGVVTFLFVAGNQCS